MTTTATTREVRLAARPVGDFRTTDLELVEVELDELGDGDVLVRNEYTLLASVYRDLMNAETALPIPNFQVGEALYGRCVGTVVRSNSPDLAVGDAVEHFQGWREHVTGPAQAFGRLDSALLPGIEYFLCNGPTAWQGMVDVAGVGEGDVVFVSGATSGVGSVAGQIAKRRGAKLVIGSTGTKEKIDYLVQELGFDAAFDYHDGSIADRLRELAPEGITVFYDNVGGEQFEAAIEVAAPFARFALCGSLAGQDDGGLPALDLLAAIGKQLTLRGFACFHTPEQVSTWNEHFGRWLGEGRFVFPHTVVEGGLPYAAEALRNLLDRKYSGNVLLKLT